MAGLLRIELRIPSSWERIEDVRQGIRGFAKVVFADDDLEYALAMATAELLENAVKYGRQDGEISALVKEHESGFVVAVTSAVDHDADIERLHARIAWLNGFATAGDAYRARIAQLASDERGRGGMGLARIGYEADCTIEARQTGGTVTVTATRR
ncbi:MAG TPA: hypothetical protein VFG83_19455 [Kofleriaceae bacterium]|nr:hypothetical protein [Kofleriaceae bacterium]